MKVRYAILTILLFISCANRNTPQAVTDDFIFNYYKLANQQVALQLTAGLATEKLEKEIMLLQEVRSQDEPTPDIPNLEYEQIGKDTSTEIENVTHVLFNYLLTIKNQSGETTHTRNVVITTENIDGKWKVVNYDEY